MANEKTTYFLCKVCGFKTEDFDGDHEFGIEYHEYDNGLDFYTCDNCGVMIYNDIGKWFIEEEKKSEIDERNKH